MKSKYKLIILLILILSMMYLVVNTFARYSNLASGKPGVNVAKWNIKIGDVEISTENNKDISTAIKMTPEVKSSVVTNGFAPGSTVTGDFTIKPENTDIEIIYAIDFGDFYYTLSGTNTVVNDVHICELKINDTPVVLDNGKYVGRILVNDEDRDVRVEVKAVWNSSSDTSDNYIGKNIAEINLPVNVKVEQSYKKYQKIRDLFDKTGTIAGRPHIGDWVTYDAGTWNEDDIAGIKIGLNTEIASNSNYKSATGIESLPDTDKKFGGFSVGKSRNDGALEYNVGTNMYARVYDGPNKDDVTDVNNLPPLSGWRIFDYDDNNLILISAANPEDYYNEYSAGSENANLAQYLLTGSDFGIEDWASENNASEICTTRDWSMYANPVYSASNARPITKKIVDSWYEKYIGTGADTDTWETDIFRRIYHNRVNQNPYVKYQNLIDNHTYYWLCTASSGYYFNIVSPVGCYVGNSTSNNAFGVRVLVSIPLENYISTESIGQRNVTLEGMSHGSGGSETYGTETRQSYNIWELREQ